MEENKVVMFFPDLERASRERKHDQRLVPKRDHSRLQDVKGKIKERTKIGMET